MQKGKLIIIGVILFTGCLLFVPPRIGKGQQPNKASIDSAVEIKKDELEEQKAISEEKLQDLSEKLNRIEQINKQQLADDVARKRRKKIHELTPLELSKQTSVGKMNDTLLVKVNPPTEKVKKKSGFWTFRWLFGKK